MKMQNLMMIMSLMMMGIAHSMAMVDNGLMKAENRMRRTLMIQKDFAMMKMTMVVEK
jgi:hypothetical protein